MTQYHEPAEELSEETRNFTRALVSLKEEIEAIYWYHQRVDTTNDEELKEILAHNRDEEIEHACMSLEWLRKRMPGWDENLRTILFSEDDISQIEPKKDNEEKDTKSSESEDLGIGKL